MFADPSGQDLGAGGNTVQKAKVEQLRSTLYSLILWVDEGEDRLEAQ